MTVLSLIMAVLGIGIILFLIGATIYFATNIWDNESFLIARIGITIMCIAAGWFAGYMAWEFIYWVIREIARLF